LEEGVINSLIVVGVIGIYLEFEGNCIAPSDDINHFDIEPVVVIADAGWRAVHAVEVILDLASRAATLSADYVIIVTLLNSFYNSVSTNALLTESAAVNE
jgi:hypothetical protein